MNRRLPAVIATLAFSLAGVGLTGCAQFGQPRIASSHRTAPPRTFALAVTVNGVLQPTPQQWAGIQAKFAEALRARGLVLVTDLALADRIIRVDFTPDPENPDEGGVARVIGTRSNPRDAATIASTTSVGRYPTSFGYLGSFQNASWSYGGYSNGYYGYGDSYYDGYSYGSATLNPVTAPIGSKPSNPPHRHNPSTREDCPPTQTYIRQLPGTLAADFGSQHTPADHPRSSPSSGNRGSWRGERTYSQSDSSPSSRPERTYSRSESSGSRGDRSYSRSDSSGSRSERSWSRSDSHSRSEPSYSHSEPSYSRSESSHSSPTISLPMSSADYSASSASPGSPSFVGPVVDSSANSNVLPH